MTERLDFHFSLSCIGEGNGNPLQCSCLENPRDRGAWWAAVYGVAQSRTRLKRLSSSSSSSSFGKTEQLWESRHKSHLLKMIGRSSASEGKYMMVDEAKKGCFSAETTRRGGADLLGCLKGEDRVGKAGVEPWVDTSILTRL